MTGDEEVEREQRTMMREREREREREIGRGPIIYFFQWDDFMKIKHRPIIDLQQQSGLPVDGENGAHAFFVGLAVTFCWRVSSSMF